MVKKTFVILLILLLAGCTIELKNSPDDMQEKIQEDKSESLSQETDIKEKISKEPIQKRCNDGTLYGECSYQKPYYCQDGSIIKKASICSCPENYMQQGENCILEFETGLEQKNLEYTLRGKIDSIQINSYKGLNDYLSIIPRSYVCDPECPTDREIEMIILDNSEQKPYLLELADKIKEKTNDKQEQVRIAISLVQSIPYADGERRRNTLQGRYPYEVVYDLKGVCGEKSRLLVFLLREIGFGTALFHYNEEKHMTAGIKCPVEFSYKESGYCFIETVEPIIPTYVPKEYIDIGELKSNPEIIQVNDGEIFNAKEEYDDARELERINKLGLVLEPKDYAVWRDLMKKYNIHVRGRMFYR